MRHNTNAKVRGGMSRSQGGLFEELIDVACKKYSLMGIAEIQKTPEPMRPLGKANTKGQFLACFVKQAQPDYKGTLQGGRAIVFEAKHTGADRMTRSVISPEQEKRLDKHLSLGAECFVLISFGFQRFYKVPWEIFRDMEKHFEKKHVKEAELKDYLIRFKEGILDFLGRF